ncbi:MAG: TaqI-like C-terminal specificity domain-containing protein, partial [Smithella sp.]
PIAVQIAKLRFFISLVVDQKVQRSKPNLGIRPLPNLESKFVAANTLIGIEKPQQMLLHNPVIDEKEKQLAEVRDSLFTARTSATKRKYRELDKRLREEIAKLLKNDGCNNAAANQLSSWDPYDQNTSAEFFDPEWMFGITSGFNIAIGNPPYIKEYTYRDAFNGLRDSQYYQGKMDLWYFFACKSLDFLQVNFGIIAFIATNNWVTNSGASILRNKITQDAKILKLLDFGDYKIFENAGIQTMVLICQRNGRNPSYNFDFRKLIGGGCAFTDVVDLMAGTKNPSCQYLKPEINRKLFVNQNYLFSTRLDEQILIKISEKKNFTLNKKNEVAQGIVAPQDFVNSKSQKILGARYTVGDGIFVISDIEKGKLSINPQEERIVKPYYTTSELYKYYGNSKNRYWLIYTDSSFNNADRIIPYPNIKRHLDQFLSVITSDNYPYGLHRSRNMFFFMGEKILSLRKCSKPIFTFTDFDCYVSQSYYVIKTKRINLKYLTGLLNSKLVAFWLQKKGKMQGLIYQIDKEPLLSIPIIAPSQKIQEEIANIVDQIISIKQNSLNSDTTMFEERIDKLIYGLYGLTKDEIAIIEEKST